MLRKQQTEAGLLICEQIGFGVKIILTLSIDASSPWIPYQFNMTSPFYQQKCRDSFPGLACSTVPARHVLKTFGEDAVGALFPSWVRMFDIYKISAACWYPARMNLSK